jgi:Zn-dependent protease
MFQRLTTTKLWKYSLLEWAILGIFAYFFVVLEPLKLANIMILMGSVVVHEWAHGMAAYRCGDPTAQQQGRLTLNPMAHLDPLGSVFLPLMLVMSGSPFLFGWAKPVPITVHRLNDPMNDMVKVAIAGPLSNITLALVFAQCLKWLVAMSPLWVVRMPWVIDVLQYGVVINIVLAVFNMIPIPPMDGSRVAYRWLPASGRVLLDKLEPYGLWIILLLAFLGFFDGVLRWVSFPIIRLLL